tara:strand:+ start:356 stop:1453 length:1098 start_codon:yes stop_codon:yes gene_type:complete
MYRYTKKVELASGTSWRFVPPQEAIDAGVVARQTFRDGRAARYEIPRLVKKVDDFRNGELVAGNIGPNSTILQISKYYISTNNYRSLAYTSQRQYEYTINYINSTSINGRTFGSIKIKDLNALHCSQAYEAWVKDISVAKANQTSRILSVLLNYCRSLDMIDTNPMSKVKKQKHKPQSDTWTKEQVELFIDTAFTNFEWRSIGLIVLLCYEWAQRPNDIRLLKWDSIDLDKSVVTITQTKRGATVQLPISDEIKYMLTQQKEDWDFQDYVVPYQRPSDAAYRPLTRSDISTYANKVKDACDLNKNLKVGNLRKSGIVEMIDSGVDHLAIMSVTGHQNISSLNPYHKHTLDAAKSALDRRKGNEKI